MSGEGNIDDIFRDKLGGHSVAPSDQVWGNIEKGLATKRKKGFLFFRWPIIALLFSGALIGGYYGMQSLEHNQAASLIADENKDEPKNEISKSEKINESATKTATQAKKESLDVEDQSQNIIEEPQQSEPVRQADQVQNESMNDSDTTVSAKNPNSIDNATEKTPQQKSTEIATGPITTNTFAHQNQNDVSTEIQTEVELTQQETKTSQSERSGTDFESTAFELEPNQTVGAKDNIWEWMASKPISFAVKNPEISDRELNSFKPDFLRSPWSIGLFYEANWNYKKVRATHEGSASLDSLISAEKSTFTSGMGFSVSYQTKFGLRITTGISYAKWCREARYPVKLPRPETATTYPIEQVDQTFYGSTGEQTIYVDNEELAGYENFFPSVDIVDFNLEVHECFQTFKIPISVGYDFYLGNWSAVPEIGLAYNRIWDSSIEVETSRDLNTFRYEQEKTYNKNALAFTGGLTLERSLTPAFKVGFSGVYSYWLSPIYKTETFKTHPYTLSGRAGVTYTFR